MEISHENSPVPPQESFSTLERQEVDSINSKESTRRQINSCIYISWK